MFFKVPLPAFLVIVLMTGCSATMSSQTDAEKKIALNSAEPQERLSGNEEMTLDNAELIPLNSPAGD